MEDKIIISAKDVCFEYEDDPGSRALKGVSLDLERGSFVAILGHNGSGKSTFAKLVNGILTPTSGKVFVNGLDTSDENNLIEIRRKVGMVFQNPDNQIVGSVVEEDVAFGPENLGIEPGEIRQRVNEALATVGMSDFKLHAPGKLSGGQKQRVAIAGILAMMPQCIVLDESTAMLDPAGRQEIISTIERLNKERNITVLLITHYMNEAAKADRVVVMNDGKVLCDGTPGEVFSRVELLESVGLDVPGPTKLLYMLKKDERFSSLPEGVVDEDEAAELISKVLKGRNKS